ncbi:GNAT family protein [Virgibacillus sp. C22-A2]|uniref:GNAT family protein n=1 Tax=Virgibacillus tibetensis TaxID=3042313 RepID=A0ABU6KKT3_9BACI|nr:GNAT family protein [Virgibacillus sp. C22-A2]
MNLSVEKMNKSHAAEILGWRYVEPYGLYNNELTEDSLKEMLDNDYFVLLDEEELAGYFCIGKSAQVPIGHQINAYSEDRMDIGLGMKPELTGQANGYAFCLFIFNHLEQTYHASHQRLTVATFNKRAIHLYKKLGFTKQKEFHNGSIEFITMVRKTE